VLGGNGKVSDGGIFPAKAALQALEAMSVETTSAARAVVSDNRREIRPTSTPEAEAVAAAELRRRRRTHINRGSTCSVSSMKD
jgi:hypothetical protein